MFTEKCFQFFSMFETFHSKVLGKKRLDLIINFSSRLIAKENHRLNNHTINTVTTLKR